MGVHRLWEILEPVKQLIPLESLVGQRLCIDLSYWIIQLSKVNGGNVRDKPHLRGLFHRIRALLALNCHLVFVTDGAIPAVKAHVYFQRLTKANPLRPNSRSQTTASTTAPLKRNKCSDFGRMIEDAKELVSAFGFPCLVSLEEGEAQCAALNAKGHCDACFTADSDAFLFGSKLVYRDINLTEGHVVAYDMNRVRDELGYGRNSLIALGVLLGCDYFPGVHGLGPERAQQIVKKFGDDQILEVMLREGPVSLARSLMKTSKNKRGEDKENCPSLWEEDSNTRQAILAYANPKCHSASSHHMQRIMLEMPVQMELMRKLCLVNFEWPFEKTDEYIYPKLGERDMRRMEFMNEAYGISEIVKKRRVRGVDYYEVRWVGKPDMRYSLVRAEHVQRSFPEKVAEFGERGRGKRRTKQLVASMQKLALDGNSSVEKSQESESVEEEAQVSADSEALTASSVRQIDVIDLTSPTPRRATPEIVDIISDEDEDVEHQERVRELKSFIASLNQTL